MINCYSIIETEPKYTSDIVELSDAYNYDYGIDVDASVVQLQIPFKIDPNFRRGER